MKRDTTPRVSPTQAELPFPEFWSRAAVPSFSVSLQFSSKIQLTRIATEKYITNGGCAPSSRPAFQGRFNFMSKLRVLIVDDHEAVRKGVSAILSSRDDLDLCGEAQDGQDAINKADALHPDVVIMDVSMPVMDGISAAREILRHDPQMAIIVLSMHDSKQLMEAARKIGVGAYVTKSQAGSTLLDAIDSVTKKKPFFPLEPGK